MTFSCWILLLGNGRLCVCVSVLVSRQDKVTTALKYIYPKLSSIMSVLKAMTILVSLVVSYIAYNN